MRLLSPEEWVGDMPEQYKHTIGLLDAAIERYTQRIEDLYAEGYRSDSPEIGAVRIELGILRGMRRDMGAARRTAEEYYVRGGRIDHRYSCLGRMRAKKVWVRTDEPGDRTYKLEKAKEQLKASIDGDLTPKQRAAVEGQYYRRLSQHETGAAEGVSQQAICDRITAAHRRLAQRVDPIINSMESDTDD